MKYQLRLVNMKIQALKFWNVSLPGVKKRAVRRLKLSTNSPTISPVKRDLHLYRVNVKSLGRPSITKEKVETFLENYENTVVVPDIKKGKKGLRYRLMSIRNLHLNLFLFICYLATNVYLFFSCL